MNSAFLKDSLSQLNEGTDAAKGLVTGLSDEQLNWRPGEGKWSIAECVDHLVVTNALYMGNLEAAIARARDKGLTVDESVNTKSTLFGGFLIRFLSAGPKKTTGAPRAFAPGSDIYADVIDRFVQTQERIATAMQRADGYDLNRIKVASPLSFTLRMNVGEAFTMFVLHNARHIAQGERVKEADGFPA